MLINTLLIFIFLLQPLQGYLTSINILPSANKTGHVWPGMVFKNFNKDSIKVNLGTGESLESQTIQLKPALNSLKQFKIEIQFETSLTVMDEGPHIDLVDWVHYRSEWIELPQKSNNKFLIPTFTPKQTSLFPKVTSKQIYEEVLKKGGLRWATHIKNVKGANDYPCGIGISKYYIRVLVFENNAWRVLNTIEFTSSMGC